MYVTEEIEVGGSEGRVRAWYPSCAAGQFSPPAVCVEVAFFKSRHICNPLWMVEIQCADRAANQRR